MDFKEQMETARRADPLRTLEALGYTVKHLSGKEYNLKEHDSLIINPRKGWYWNSRNIGGRSTIDLVMALEGIEKPLEAAKVILGITGSSGGERAPEGGYTRTGEEKTFTLPERNRDNKRVFNYLHRARGISMDVIKRCVEEGLLYESARSHNAVFVGKDSEGIPRYAFERGTDPGKRYVRERAGSRKEYGFRLEGPSQTLHVFESAVDALSFLTMQEYLGESAEDTCLALSGTTLKALDKYLEDRPDKIRFIDVRTDNDPAGYRVYENISKKYGDAYKVSCRIPEVYKDYNEVLLKVNEMKDRAQGEDLSKMVTDLIRDGPGPVNTLKHRPVQDRQKKNIEAER